jgi:hypothetical protein
MPKYYRHYYDNGPQPPNTPIGALKGGKLANSSRVHSAIDSIDRCPALGRRILLACGMSGSDEFATNSGSASSTTRRIVARGRANLTPGCMLAMTCMYLPSDDTSDIDGFGQLELTVVWTDRDGNQETTTHTLTLEPNETDLPLNSNGLSLWSAISVRRISSITPGSIVSIETASRWSRHTHVEMTLAHYGGTRVIDSVVYEQPDSFAIEADDDSNFWVSGLFASGQPGAQKPNLDYPLQRMSETTPDGNPRGGTWQMMDTINAQQLRLGPMLVCWNGHHEEADGLGVANDDYVAASAAANTWVRVPDSYSDTDPLVLTAEDQPGWDVSAGAYALDPSLNSDVSMGTNGSIPVRVRVAMSSGENDVQPFDLRVYTAPYSYIEISGTAPLETDGPQWFSTYGHLRVGRGPGDPAKATAVMRRTTTADEIRCHAIVVEKAGQYAEPTTLPTSGLFFHVDVLDNDSYPGSGSTVTELVNSHTGTMTSITVDGSGNFNYDSGSKLNFPYQSGWNQLWDGGGTIVTIFRAESDGQGDFGYVCGNIDGAIATDGWASYMSNESGSNVDLNLWVQRTSTDGIWTVTTTLNDWHIAIWTYDDDLTANNPTLYLDGSVVSLTETSTPAGSIPADTNDWAIGNRSDSAVGRSFDGDINVLLAYDRAITSQDAAAIFEFFRGQYGL